MKYALKNAVILDGTQDMEPLRGQSVLVEGETIVGLAPAGSEPMGFEPVDLTGKSDFRHQRRLMRKRSSPTTYLGSGSLMTST